MCKPPPRGFASWQRGISLLPEQLPRWASPHFLVEPCWLRTHPALRSTGTWSLHKGGTGLTVEVAAWPGRRSQVTTAHLPSPAPPIGP